MSLSIRKFSNTLLILENVFVVLFIIMFKIPLRYKEISLKETCNGVFYFDNTWCKYRKYMIEGFCNIYFDANKGAYRRNDTSVAIDA